MKPKQVDFIRHPATKATVPLMLNRNDLTFFAQVGTTTFTGASAKEVKTQVHAFLERSESIKINWQPAIELSLGRGGYYDGGNPSISLQCERFYLGVHTAANEPRLLRLAWVNYDHDYKNSIFYRGKNLADINQDLERLGRAERFYDNTWDGKTELSFPYRPGGEDSGGDLIIEYDESTWEGLQAIEKGIIELGKKLDKVLHTEAGRKRVKLAGAKKLKLLSF